MIVDAYIACPLVIHSTGFGLREDVDIVKTDETNAVVSRHFHPHIVNPADIEKIKMPVVTYDQAQTEANYAAMCEIFGGILPVVKVGKKGTWFAPWDELIRWWGVQEAMRDLVDRPEMVEAAISRLVDAYLCELDQWEALNLLTRNDDATCIGSGGYGHTNALPGPDLDPAHPRTRNLWGCATAQIFGSVSPKMHWDFALKHELRWLERWGADLLRLLRAARRQDGHPPPHPEPAQGLHQPVGKRGSSDQGDRRPLRHVAQTESRLACRGRLAAGYG